MRLHRAEQELAAAEAMHWQGRGSSLRTPKGQSRLLKIASVRSSTQQDRGTPRQGDRERYLTEAQSETAGCGERSRPTLGGDSMLHARWQTVT